MSRNLLEPEFLAFKFSYLNILRLHPSCRGSSCGIIECFCGEKVIRKKIRESNIVSILKVVLCEVVLQFIR